MAATAESLGQPGADVYTLNTADGFGFTLLHRYAQRSKRRATRLYCFEGSGNATQSATHPDCLRLTVPVLPSLPQAGADRTQRSAAGLPQRSRRRDQPYTAD